MKTKAAKAAYDRARWLRIRPTPRASRTGWCQQCRVRFEYGPIGRARRNCMDCDPPHEAGHRGPVLPPMPMPYVGHPVFEQAAKVARLTSIAFSVDWGQNDIMGEATLAILEGRDPAEAVRAFRAAEKRIDRSRRWVADIGTDEDGHIYAAKDYDDD